jgi:hypothetical protein
MRDMQARPRELTASSRKCGANRMKKSSPRSAPVFGITHDAKAQLAWTFCMGEKFGVSLFEPFKSDVFTAGSTRGT